MAKSKAKTTKKNTAGSRSAASKTTGRKTSGGNKTRSNNTRSNTTRNNQRPAPYVSRRKKNDNPLRRDFFMILAAFVTIFMTLGNFGVCGKVGTIITDIFFGIFGVVQYVMPIVIFIGIFFLIANNYSYMSIRKCASGFCFLMMISSFAQMAYEKELDLMELMSLGEQNHLTGGIIGGGFAVQMRDWFNPIGAVIIITCVMILSLITLTQKSFIDFIENVVYLFRESARKRALEREKQKQYDDYEYWQDEQQPEIGINLRELRGQSAAGASRESSEIKENKQNKEKKSGKPGRSRRKEAGNEKLRTQQCEDIVRGLKEDMDLTETATEYPDYDSAQHATPVFTSKEELEEAGVIEQLDQGEYPLHKDDLSVQAIPIHSDMYTADTDTGHDQNEDHDSNIEETEEASEELKEQRQRKRRRRRKKGSKEESIRSVSDSADTEQDEKTVGKSGEKADENTDISITVKQEAEPGYIFPPVSLLNKNNQTLSEDHEGTLRETAARLKQTLASFGVNVTITDISCGPTVTRYEMLPEQGTRVNTIVKLTDDIKLNLAATDIRIEAPIPGKRAIGIEVPNKEKMTVRFRDIIDNDKFRRASSKVAFAVGKDISGNTVIADIDKMPHLLIAGQTGAGKSVCINTLIMSFLYKAKPDEVKMIMIDPKMVELNVYNGIPHLLIPVVTDSKKAAGALNWAVAEMDRRYREFEQYTVKNIESYNKKIDRLVREGEFEDGAMAKMPRIVVIIDELADLMMVAKHEVEEAVVRLSQLARAAGIHLVIATQRPSVDVITGLIKANVPSRIAFAVASGVDSRTVINMAGAEKLLGNGDMLFFPTGYPKPVRVQGAFITEEEVAEVVAFVKDNETIVTYDDSVTDSISRSMSHKESTQERDEYFEAAARFIIEKDKATIGLLQRMFKVGFNRAARLMDQLADAGIVGPEEGTKPRKILMSPEELEQYFEECL